MTNDSKIHSILGTMATFVVIASIAGAGIYIFRYFINANKDIVAHDLKIVVERQGTGLAARRGDTVLVNYIGMLSDGTEFDNSYRRREGKGEPLSITIGEGSLEGFEQGLLGMKVGEKRIMTIPPSLGFGVQSIPDGKGGYLIPPNSTLIYETEMLDITRH